MAIKMLSPCHLRSYESEVLTYFSELSRHPVSGGSLVVPPITIRENWGRCERKKRVHYQRIRIAVEVQGPVSIGVYCSVFGVRSNCGNHCYNKSTC